jgi:murein DD-endopeptidase MepM/ murein hydrolase activator NlpD
MLLFFGLSLGAPGVPVASEDAVYRVRRGDNLTAIAQRFGSSVGALKQANRLSSDLIHVGQVLTIRRPLGRIKSQTIRWSNPLPQRGEVLRPFGPYKEGGVLMPRTGADIACERGTIVRSPADGVVRWIGVMDGYGLLVIVEHGGGYSTVLGPLEPDSIEWVANEAVVAGDVLGRVGPPVVGERSYLHVELRRNDRAVAPDNLLH